MKIRLIDTQLVPALRKPVDTAWSTFANHLITAFGDITQRYGFPAEDADMVYCRHRMRELDEQILDSLVYNIPPAFVSQATLEGADSETAHSYFDARLQWRSTRDSPFLLLGYVGTGKTTFLDHYFCTYLPKHRPDISAIIVDFKTAPDRQDDFVLYMLEQIDRSLSDIDTVNAGMTRDVLERLFDLELRSIRSSIHIAAVQELEIDRLFALVIRAKMEKDFSTYQRYLGKRIAHLQASGRFLWIILDNIDQHFHCLHHHAFVNAVSIANAWGCPLIIAMRYVTLHMPAARQTYDSFRPRRLKLSFPDVKEMIDRRIDYFKMLADPLLDVPLSWTGGTMKVSDLAREIRECAKLISSPGILQRFLLPLSNYNLRRMLEIVLSAFQSYYFYFDRFNSDRYVPNEKTIYKRLMFAHLLKNNDYYDPSSRNDQDLFIVNLFDNENQASVYNQTIRIRILQGLLHFGRHISLARFVAHISERFVYDRDDLLRGIKVFMDKELVAMKNIVAPTFDDAVLHIGIQEKDLEREDLEIALTYSGRMHYDLLLSLEYIEIMKMSTYVDTRLYHDIQSPDEQVTFEKRAKGTRKFVEYLFREEEKEFELCVRDRTTVARIMPEIIASVTKALNVVGQLPEHRRLS